MRNKIHFTIYLLVILGAFYLIYLQYPTLVTPIALIVWANNCIFNGEKIGVWK